MLRRPATWQRAIRMLMLALVLVPLPARGHAYAAIRRPEQLTVGVSDDFLGQLSPDGRTLFFLSDRNILHEVYHQDLEAARAVLVFDEGSDVTWVRVSPDARHLLYISFRDEAAGQLCVRELHTAHNGEVTAHSGRRCLDDGSRPVQAQWTGSSEIALVSRSSLQGDLRLARVAVGRHLTAQLLLERNLTSPTVSPDGRWLVYVPVQRFIDGVGPGFAARAAAHLEVVPIDAAGKPGVPQKLALDLPGQSGQPTFSTDGRYLYFAQFFNDTNRDGLIDASDHGVLFRVPFAGDQADAAVRAAHAFPEQLTDSSWNCQYPSPAAATLIATCSHGGNLDVYSLPLDGVVPGDWDGERLRLEIELSTRRNDLLLLYRHLLQREKKPAQRHLDMTRLIMLHLEQEEFHAAEFYAHELDRERGDPAIMGLGPVLLAHVDHRRGMSRRERGRAGTFRQDARARLDALAPEESDESVAPTLGSGEAQSAAAAALRQVVRSEITDSLGDKSGALRELKSAELEPVEVPAVLEAYYDRADALYREVDDADALYAVGKQLSAHPRLLPEERLRYARSAVRALCRGQKLELAQSLLRREKATVAPDSELYFALALAQQVLSIRDSHPPAAVQEALLALYRQQTRPERRHVVMMDAGERATELDAPEIVESLVQVYVDDVPKGTRERQRAERLYQRVLEGRAYRQRAAGQLVAARDSFALVARTTGSLESSIEYIDLRLREGATPTAITAEYEQPGAHHSDGVSRFVRAYLLALKLPHLGDPRQHEATVQKAMEILRGGWHTLHAEPTVRVLFGMLLHEQFLSQRDQAATGDNRYLEAAQRADIHYLVALNLLRNNPRYRALVLEQLGLLQAQVGNYRIALGYLQDREKLPFPEAPGRLVHYLVKAQTLQHLDRIPDAAKAVDEALLSCDGAPELAEYRQLVLDRAALYNLSAGHFARALPMYDAEVPLLESAGGAVGARNRLVVRLARAAAALGAGKPGPALADLAVADQKLSEPTASVLLKWPHTSGPESLRAYQIIAAGLRARAHRAAGQLPEAVRALTVQATLLDQRHERTRLDEHLRPLALAEGQLAELLQESGDSVGAGKWLGKALDHAETYMRHTKISVSPDQLALLWLAAELHVTSVGHLGLDFAARLRTAHERLVKGSSLSLRGYGRLLEMYLPLVAP